MLKSKMMAALAILGPLCFASVVSGQAPTTPERPAKSGVEARAAGVASRAEARAVPSPSPSAKGVGGAAALRSNASAVAARGPMTATPATGAAVPSRAALAAMASEKGSSQARRVAAERLSSLDGVIPTLSAPIPETAVAGPLADVIRQARVELRPTRGGDALRRVPQKPAGKEGNGGAKH